MDPNFALKVLSSSAFLSLPVFRHTRLVIRAVCRACKLAVDTLDSLEVDVRLEIEDSFDLRLFKAVTPRWRFSFPSTGVFPSSFESLSPPAYLRHTISLHIQHPRKARYIGGPAFGLVALSAFHNLRTLSIRTHTPLALPFHVSGLSALASLAISSVDDELGLGSLLYLPSLRSLSLTSVECDMSPLKRLTLLENLSMRDCVDTSQLEDPHALLPNPIPDLSAFVCLRALSVYECSFDVRTLTTLTSLRAVEIELREFGWGSLAVLATTMTQLESLSFNSSLVDDWDVSVLSPLTSLRHLSFRSGVASSGLDLLTSLRSLAMFSWYELSLATLTQLHTLRLEWFCPLAEPDPVPSVRELVVVEEHYNETHVDGEHLHVLFPSLTSLTLNVAQEALNLHAFSSLTSLSLTRISPTRVPTDLSFLRSLTSLQSLALSNVHVDDAAPLHTLPALRALDVSGTRFADEFALSTMTALTSLDARRSNISTATLPPILHLKCH